MEKIQDHNSIKVGDLISLTKTTNPFKIIKIYGAYITVENTVTGEQHTNIRKGMFEYIIQAPTWKERIEND